MLTIEALRRGIREFGALPALTRLGLAVMVFAGALDVVVHIAGAGQHHAGHSGVEHLAHLAGIVGMVLVLAGVVIDGARRQLARRRGGAVPGGLSDAHR